MSEMRTVRPYTFSLPAFPSVLVVAGRKEEQGIGMEMPRGYNFVSGAKYGSYLLLLNVSIKDGFSKCF